MNLGMLQRVWRWLYDRLHNIRADGRVEIMKKIRQILYCETEVEQQKVCHQFLNSNLIKKYGNALIYFSDLFLSKQEWAVCYRNNSLLRGSNTNNYVEAQFLVIKDSILRRERQFNVNMLLDKLFSVFEEHFKIKLLSLADGTFDRVYSKCFMRFSKTQKTGIDFFLVSKKRFFFAIYLFFDPIKLALSVCSSCVRLSMTCFFIKTYGGG